MVEHTAVNRGVVGSSPTRGVFLCPKSAQIIRCCIIKSFFGKDTLEVITMGTIWKENGIFESSGTERGESLWVQKQYRYENESVKNEKTRPSLQGDITTEVAVIGAGLAGVLTAYLLAERGHSVVVLECRETGSGMTRNTTAKVTSQHGLIYHKLMMYKGEQRTWEYAAANQQALEKYEEIINQLEIDCDFEILPNFIYTLDNEMKIKQEVDAAKKVGLPASFTKDATLPFPIKAAARFDNQAQFHPLKFLDAVAKNLTIYEHTRVTEVRSDGFIITDQGSVKAKSIVIATHYPFINVPGYYFFKLHQERQYVVALDGCETEKKARMNGMYLDAYPDGFSFRNYKDYLILGSGNHRTGQYKPLDAYLKLEEASKRWYPNAKIKYTWSNQDCMTPDSIPYIGRYSANTRNIYVATGFNKWGMTSSMVSAMIISDMIAGKENEYQKVFNPRRLMLSGSRVFLKDAAIITISLLSEHLNIPHDKIGDIEKGKAGVINKDGQRIGAYRDNNDKYYFVSTKCPHLGCKLEWNQNELTWDCPCHGSRFDYRGNLINNPAMRDVFDTCQRKKKSAKND
jgi:glycine/D-amino acid oxidase-like deaminating enzyme/nitrite reductase/ring-hydroxylating ferredoxin subunit